MCNNKRIFGVVLASILTFVVGLNPAFSGGVASGGSNQEADLAMIVRSAALDATDTTDRMIIKLRDPVSSDADWNTKMVHLGNRAGVPLTHLRAMSGGTHVARLAQRLNRTQARALAKALALDPTVEYVEPDFRVYPQISPNDTYYSAYQWDLFEAAGGINAPAAWDITTGSSSIYVAVIDTGIVAHAELAGRVVGGYDFIADSSISNDGDGRDANASDPGDYCGSTHSSWHGTHVAGTIGAIGNNATGVAGINWVSKIVPIRVLGACGGYTSDIADGMRWAAGISVPGVPANPYPARVENLSLGGSGACSLTFQSAVTDVVARGTVVVVAAGNSNVDAANFQPANCNGVIAVAATTRAGGRASFSNFGSKVAIAAPGVNILSTVNTGATTPVGDGYALYNGTSMATPHVTGVVSLMLSQNSALTPAQVLQRLQSTARPFPTGTGLDCTTALCGAGIVNAAAALVSTPPPPARVNVASQANGGVASASSIYGAGWAASGANNGDRSGIGWSYGGGWNDNTYNAFPDWLQIDFSATKTIGEIDVFTLQDNYDHPVEPTPTMTFSGYGIIDFQVQYWDGSGWVTVPAGSVTGNNLIWRKFTFSAISTNRIRVLVTSAASSFSRITEVEAYAP